MSGAKLFHYIINGLQYKTFSDEPGGHARTDRPVNNNAAFASVARGRLAKYSLGEFSFLTPKPHESARVLFA